MAWVEVYGGQGSLVFKLKTPTTELTTANHRANHR